VNQTSDKTDKQLLAITNLCEKALSDQQPRLELCGMPTENGIFPAETLGPDLQNVTKDQSVPIIDDSANLEKIVTSRVQALTSAISDAQQKTASFAEIVTNVEACKEIAGKHTMIIAIGPGSVIHTMVKQYSQAAKSAPLTTSACLMVPNWPKAAFNHYLRGTTVLYEYPAGTHAKYPTKLVYAPQETMVTSSSIFTGDSPLTMTFRGKLAGSQAYISVDSQASHDFINDQWVRRVGVHMLPMTGQATLASGELASNVTGLCTLRMQTGPLMDVVECMLLYVRFENGHAS